jgi:hypothetical protein
MRIAISDFIAAFCHSVPFPSVTRAEIIGLIISIKSSYPSLSPFLLQASSLWIISLSKTRNLHRLDINCFLYKDRVLYCVHYRPLRFAAQYSMSLNACEAYLLEIRKDEIWQLLYIQRQSEGEAYETLVRKGLGWLGYAKDR